MVDSKNMRDRKKNCLLNKFFIWPNGLDRNWYLRTLHSIGRNFLSKCSFKILMKKTTPLRMFFLREHVKNTSILFLVKFKN